MTHCKKREIHRLHIYQLLVSAFVSVWHKKTVLIHHCAQFIGYWSPLSTGKMKDETLMTPVGEIGGAEAKNG